MLWLAILSVFGTSRVINRMLKMLFTLILVAFVGLSSAQSTTQGTANLFGLQDYAELFIASVIDSVGDIAPGTP